jgi:carboxyl-terminal processing protease
MSRIILPSLLLSLFLLGQMASAGPEKPVKHPTGDPAAEGKEPTPQPESVARRLWTLTDVVLDNHIEPPTRQEMLLAAIKGLMKQASVPPPVGLSRRVSRVLSEKDFAALLQDVWPTDGARKPVRSAKLGTALIDGMFQSVPGSAHLLVPMEDKRLEQIMGNRYEGTGVQVGIDNDSKMVKIITPVRRGPMHRAGARPGDLIVRVNDVDVTKASLTRVVSLLSGKAGTPVTVVVRQPGAKEARTLKIQRAVIPFETVQGYRRADKEDWTYRADQAAGIAYVVVRSITSSTLHELRQIERRLKADGCRALVLDLRYTSGGTLGHAAQLADGLLDGGVMWQIRDAGDSVKEFRAERDCLFRDWPLAVLINEFSSAMGTELFAAALQDNRRAVLVGEPSKGDGYINQLVKVPGSKEMLRLRAARVERAGAPRKPWAVRPDYKVSMTQTQKDALSKWLIQKDWTELPAGTTDKPPEDPQLARALEVLRASLKSRAEGKKPH